MATFVAFGACTGGVGSNGQGGRGGGAEGGAGGEAGAAGGGAGGTANDSGSQGGATSGGAGGASGGTGGATSGGVGGAASGGTGGTTSGGAGGASGGAGGATSGGVGGAASGGAGGAAPITPRLVGGRYRFVWDDKLLEIDPALGGRVTVFSLGGANVLTGPEVEPSNWGSTFWPSPQSAWGWPPPPELDDRPYSARVEGAALVLRSASSASVRLSVEKRFSIDADGSVRMVFEMTNTGTTAANWAPWQVTRVAPGGLSIFELGPGGTQPVGTWTPAPLAEHGGWQFYDDAALVTTTARKTFADGRGWLAHVVRGQRLLFVKLFHDVPAGGQATGEAEIELFVDNLRRYVELEPQGASVQLAANASLSWTVRWRLRALDPGIALGPGSQALVEAVRATLD